MQDFINTLLQETSKIAKQNFGIAKETHTKRDALDSVTAIDGQINQHIVSAIRAAYPDHDIVAEEGDSRDTQADWVWYVDPIDGTSNYAVGIPIYGIMISVAHKGVMQHAGIAEPTLDNIYLASLGKGSFCNGVQFHCGEHADLEYSEGTIPAYWLWPRQQMVQAIFSASVPLRANGFGSIAISSLCTADGRRDWFLNQGAGIHDYPAPALIMQEAGCLVTKMDGTAWKPGDREMIAANPVLHAKLLGLIKNIA